MDLNFGESLNSLEESLLKTINEFSHSFDVINKPDAQVMLWLDTLNNVVVNILDVYKICLVTRNNIFCQNISESLDSLKKVIKTVAKKETKVDTVIPGSEQRTLLKVQDTNKGINNSNCNSEKYKTPSTQVEAVKNSITFGDVDYDLIMKDLNKVKLCENLKSTRNNDDSARKKKYSDSFTQTDLSIMTSFPKINRCSVGVQVDCAKHISSDYFGNNFNSDYNLIDPYLFNQNFEETYQNIHYYNGSCSFQNEIDRSYPEPVSNFNHQYQPIPCSSVPLPGRNISAPVFLPRMISPSPGHHTSDHHHSSLPYAITMLSSNQSYMPGTFSSSAGPPHYLGIPSHGYKESKRSHRKSELILGKKNKGTASKSRDGTRNSQSKDKFVQPSESNIILPDSSEEQVGYLAKLDLLEKACNFDLASCQCYFSSSEITSCKGDKSNEIQTEDSSSFIKTIKAVEVPYNFITDIKTSESNLKNISNYKSSDDQSNFSDNCLSELEISSQNNSNDLSGTKFEFCESPAISVLKDVYDNASNISKLISSQSSITSGLNDCNFPKLGNFESQINNEETPLIESLNSVEPILENTCNITEDTCISKKMDVKLSFVNVLTSGLKVSMDTSVCSVEKKSSDSANQIEETYTAKLPDAIELSDFPSLKTNTQTVNKSEQVLYFEQHKSQLTPMFELANSVAKSEKESLDFFEGHRSSHSSVIRLAEKSTNGSGKNKDVAPVKKSIVIGDKGFPTKKNISMSDNKKSGKCNYQQVKHSSNSNSKPVKEDMNSAHSSISERKNHGGFNSVNKNCKTEELFLSKKNTVSKRKSVPGEDGWTTVSAKLRSHDCWTPKDFVNKTVNYFSLLSDDMVKSNSEITEIDQATVHTDSSAPNENGYSLPTQQRYFSSPVQIDHSSSFFEEGSSLIGEFDLCHKLNDNGFTLPSMDIINNVDTSPNFQSSFPDKYLHNISLSNYQLQSAPSLLNLSPTSDCSDGIHVSKVSSSDYLEMNSLVDETCLIDDEYCASDFARKSIDDCNHETFFEGAVPNDESLFLDDSQIMKSSIYEENELSNFLSQSSAWCELKPDTDGDDQHLNEEDVRKSRELQEEALMLRKKIKALQLNENEIDTENEGEFENDNPENIDPHEIFTEYSHYLSQISSWGDQMDEMERFQEMLSSDPNDSIFKFQYGSIEQFREFVARHPSKAVDLHYKLLVRSKRSNSDEQYEIRRKKAEEKRQRLLNRKAAKMRELLQRVEEVRQAQLQIIEERKCRIDFKLKKAEENRNLHLKTIQKKAHDEEEKLKEIAFINELEAQNRRHDSMALRQEQEERLQNIMEERQRKVDEKAAKEAAVGERKRVLEAERMEKIEKIQQKRREKEEIIGKKQQERELERLVTAREKAREREERLQARQAAQIANVEELQKKIKKKQENSARRHEENIQHIRQKAVETGMFRNILSEDSNSDASLKNISSVDKKKSAQTVICDIEQLTPTKTQRKKCKKIRTRLQKSGAQYLLELEHGSPIEDKSSVFSTLKSNINYIVELTELSTVSGLAKLEKHLLKIVNLISKNLQESRSCFKLVQGFEIVLKTLVNLVNSKILLISLSYKCIECICEILYKICENNISNIQYFISCSDMCGVLDGINFFFSNLLCSKLEVNPSLIQISALLLKFQGMILRCCSISSTGNSLITDRLHLQLKDTTSYLFHCGLLDRIGEVIKLASLESAECKTSEQLIEPIICFVSVLIHSLYFWKEFEDLLVTTDFMGTVSLLYGHLHQAQQSLPSFTLSIIKFFKTLASEQHKLFQKVLGSEGISLQFRYIASIILQHCILSGRTSMMKELLNHTILIIGYFALKNPENQLILQSGQTPTVLQQLISVPIQYFCEPELKCVLFPTLIAVCDGNSTNRELLENEMSYNHIECFLEDPICKSAELMRVLRTYDLT